MAGEHNLEVLIANMSPKLNDGTYVYCMVTDISTLDHGLTLFEFKESEGTTLVLRKEDADRLGLAYDYEAAWITLQVHSSLVAIGLTAAVAQALAQEGVSCNVVAAYHHDHIFVDRQDAQKAVKVLSSLSRRSASGK